MRHLISILVGVALVFSTNTTSFAEQREFKDCTYEGNLRAHGEFHKPDRPEGDPIPVHGHNIGVEVECEDDTEYGLRSVIVYTTFWCDSRSCNRCINRFLLSYLKFKFRSIGIDRVFAVSRSKYL